MYPDVSGKPDIQVFVCECVCIYIYMTDGQIDSQIICSALCHTDAVMNLPTDVSADLTLT